MLNKNRLIVKILKIYYKIKINKFMKLIKI